jgi:hypothetical protein
MQTHPLLDREGLGELGRSVVSKAAASSVCAPALLGDDEAAHEPDDERSRVSRGRPSINTRRQATGVRGSQGMLGTRKPRCDRLDAFVGRRIVQPFGLLGNNIGVLDLYSRYDAPNRISNSRSSYTFRKTSNAGVTRKSTQSTKSTD